MGAAERRVLTAALRLERRRVPLGAGVIYERARTTVDGRCCLASGNADPGVVVAKKPASQRCSQQGDSVAPETWWLNRRVAQAIDNS